MSLVNLVNELNWATTNSVIGVESPIYVIGSKGKIDQKGCYRSTMVTFDLNPIVNPGVSGSVYFCGVETHRIKANLSYQVSIWGIDKKLKWEEKVKLIKSRIEWVAKPGMVLKHGDLVFKCDTIGDNKPMDSGRYKKGMDFSFEVKSIPSITYQDVRDNGYGVLEVNLRVQGYHVVEDCNAEKVASEATKACFTPNPVAKGISDLKYGGFIIYEGHVSPSDIKSGKAVRVPHTVVTLGSEAAKGNQITLGMYAATKFCLTAEQTEIKGEEVKGIKGVVYYPSDDLVDEVNNYITKYTYKVTGVRTFSDEFAGYLKSKGVKGTWVGNTLIMHGTALYGMHHTTTELSLTEENRSSQKGRVYWEAIQAISGLNRHLGEAIYVTGAKNRQLRNVTIKVAHNELPETPVFWGNDTVFQFTGDKVADLFKQMPVNLVLEHSAGHQLWVNPKLGLNLGLTEEGGLNLIARTIVDVVKMYTIPVEDRDIDWITIRDKMLNLYHSCCKNQLTGDKNKLLKDSTKSGRITQTMKVRGIEAPWVKRNEVYIASSDPNSSKLQGTKVLYWRNPNPSYCVAVVKVVGPATEYCPNPDIVTPRQVIGKATFTVPALDWYGSNNGDDDGDLVCWINLQEVAEYVTNPRNHKEVSELQSIFHRIYG